MAGKAARKEGREAPESAAGGLSLDEAAAVLNVSRSTLTRWLNEGRVRGRKVGRQWRFRRSDLEKFGQMSHPSAAAVNVAEVKALTQQLRDRLPALEEVATEPELRDYPGTEEEKAIEALFETLMAGALPLVTTDIHIDPQPKESVVSYRIDGVLQEVARLPQAMHRALVAGIKLHASMAPEQEQVAQDGHFGFRHGTGEYDYRISTMPAAYGEFVTVRLFDRSHLFADLDRIGMVPEDQERYLRALVRPLGLVIVAGPTGSGKTTVLYSGLKRIMGPEKRTFTIEDPVAGTLQGATQIPVNRRLGMTQEHILRTLMRHDPDVIASTDISSLETAELCVGAAVTGHLVLATLHSNSAASAIARLLDLGLDPFMLTEGLTCVVSTRLARKACPSCVQPYDVPFDILSPFAERARRGGCPLPADPKFVKGAGCDSCRGTGYKGRTGLFEVMEINDEIARLILARESARAIQEAAVRNGMTTMVADGLRKAVMGITTVMEAARVTHTADE
jgi:excisionase family DNA binding protein